MSNKENHRNHLNVTEELPNQMTGQTLDFRNIDDILPVDSIRKEDDIRQEDIIRKENEDQPVL
jgi:hypothetical protein